MDTIRRKSLLYRSGVGFGCIDAAQGCSHGCRYPCYAFMMAKHHGRVRWYFYREQGRAVRAFCRERGIDADVDA